MAEIIYSLTLYCCALGMAGLGEFVWRRYAQDPVARRFVVFCLIAGVWIFFCALDVLTRDLAIRTLMLQVRSAVIFFASASALSLVLAFTGHSRWLRHGRFYLLLAIPTTAALLVLTSGLQPWFMTDFRLVEAGIRARMVYTPQIGFKLYLLYTYGCFMACCAVLAWSMRGKPPLYRRQASLLLLGLLIPTLTDLLFTYEERAWVWFRGAYLTPFSMMAFALLSAWALFRYRLFELAPVARNRVIENMADAVLVFDVHGRVADFNPAAQRLLGLGGNAVGRSGQDIFACCPELAAGVGTPGERLLSMEACANPPQTLTGRLSPLFGRQGEFCGQVLLLHDSSALQQAQRQLADTTALLEAAFAQTPIPMLLADMPSGRLRIVNPACRRHLRMDDGTEPVGMGYAELAQNWPMLDAGGAALAIADLPLARAMRGETVQGQELGVRRADGTLAWELVTAAPVFNAAGEQIAAFAAFPDITARKQAEAELNRARDAAEAASRAKSLFLATVSHEIRTPLNAILGFAQVLQRDTGLSATQHGHLATIQRSGEHLLRLIHDILDMAKIEAGRMEAQAQPFGLRQTLLEMEQLFLPKARDKGLALSVETAAGLPESVNGDETKLRQVLINLLVNAIKFTPAGSVSLQVEAAAAGSVLFRVTDTGLGIAAEEMPKLFLPFSQTSSGLKVREGTGLGLALCSQFVRLMGGELEVSSVAGHGACFFFTLPLPAAAAMPPPARRKQPPVAGLAPGQPPCQILIADGQDDDRAPLRALLETLNPDPPVLQFREAANVRETLDCLAAEPVDVLFISLGLLESADVDARQPLLAQLAGPGLVVALAAPDANPPADLFPPGLGVEFARKPIQADALFAILLRRTPLQFVRQADVAAAAPLLKQALAAQLAECPAAWLKDLRAALDRGDSARIGTLIEPLRTSDPGLHQILAKWAYDCDHEAFIDALDASGAPPPGQA